jgi:hypothetical protein
MLLKTHSMAMHYLLKKWQMRCARLRLYSCELIYSAVAYLRE